MKKIDLEIFDISLNGGSSGAYVMVLLEKGGRRKIPILIGGFEAQYIAIELENLKPSRPLTHDLFKSTLISFDMNVTEIVIFDYKEGVFFAKIVVTDGEKLVEIDSRTSDAIALALRYKAPIYTYNYILKKAGFTAAVSGSSKKISEDNWIQNFVTEKSNTKEEIGDLKKLSIPKLKTLLTKLVNQESYEKAARVRDELSKRKS